MRRLQTALRAAILSAITSGFAGLAAPNPLSRQGLEEAERLKQQTIEFYKQGRYKDVEQTLQRFLAITEKARGPDHPDIAAQGEEEARTVEEQARA